MKLLKRIVFPFLATFALVVGSIGALLVGLGSVLDYVRWNKNRVVDGEVKK